MGPKGLSVLAITHESREQVLKLLAQAPPAGVSFTIGLGGGNQNYPNLTGTVPYAWLISAEGKCVWQGNTGSLSEKVIAEEVKKVRLTDEMKAAKAAKALEYAEGLVAEKHLVRAIRVLDRVAKSGKGTEAATKAAERKAALEKDEALKAELAAQKTLDSLVGGLELPKDKLKKKDRESLALRLDAFIKKVETDAPVAAATARMWVKVMNERWEDGAK
jgi:hypothetical protein